MRTHHATRSPAGRCVFDIFDFRTVGGPLPLHLHVRRWRSNGTVAALLVYAPTRGAWYEGADMPEDVRAFALAALAERLGDLPAFAFTSAVRS
jgi:hypothetical protein